MAVPLHVKSHYSLGVGTASVEALVDRAAGLGHRVLALTDLDSLAAQPRFHDRCRSRDLPEGCLTVVEVRQSGDGAPVRLAVLLAASRRHPLGAGGAVQFLTLEDETGLLEATVRRTAAPADR